MATQSSGVAPVSLMWAKAPERLIQGDEPYPVLAHLLDTAAAVGAVWDHWLCPRLRQLLRDELAPGSEEMARRWVQAAAGLHDLGKASSVFQTQAGSRRVLPWREQHSRRLAAAGFPGCSDLVEKALRTDEGRAARRHELVGFEALLPRMFTNVRRLSVGSAWLALAVAGHHGHWQSPALGDISPDLLAEMTCGPWGDMQRELSRAVLASLALEMTEVPVVAGERAGIVVTLVTGLVILADWLASSDQVVEQGLGLIQEGLSPLDGGAWLGRRETQLPEVVRGCLGAFSAPTDALTAVLGYDEAGHPRTPRPLQEDALSVQAGAWFVAYPTGEGKTEAALLRHLVDPQEGLIFGLPTRATTDAMQTRLEQMLSASGNPVVLSHQFAAVHRVECSGTDGLAWFSSPVRRLIAPVVAATCDQVLMGALRRKHAALRLLALANHHVVLDEVHTFDHYQTGLLTELMAWWGATGTRVTILSATLPGWQQNALADAYQRGSSPQLDPVYPSHRLVAASPQSPCSPPLSTPVPPLPVELVHADDADAAHVRWALEAHARHPMCHLAVIRSTVDDAVTTARALAEHWQGAEIDVICLHSRMTVSHRRVVESALVDRLGPQAAPGRPIAVVATQVVEASLDLDLDLMSTDLVPGPALIQRVGRLWRFRDASARRARFGAAMPCERAVHIVVRTEGGQITERSSLPYFPAELRRVRAWLEAHPVVTIPDKVQDFVDSTTLDLETAEIHESGDEIGLVARQREALREAAAPLRGRIVEPPKHTKYADLVRLTGDGASAFESLGPMPSGTRFSERESVGLLLLDGPRGARVGAEVLADATDPGLLVRALDAVVPVSGRVLAALTKDEQVTDWNPRSVLLRNFRPVDSSEIARAGLRYEDQVGLCWAEETVCS